jgi:hypothetical protein
MFNKSTYILVKMHGSKMVALAHTAFIVPKCKISISEILNIPRNQSEVPFLSMTLAQAKIS